MLQEHLARYKDIFQYVYSHVFPEVYTTSEKQAFDLKSNFLILFKTYRNKMLMRQQAIVKNPVNYETEQRKETCKFEQKPMKNSDEFSNSEEQEAKRRAERREKVEDLKERKCKIKSEEDKIQEGEMWNRLNELNGEF